MKLQLRLIRTLRPPGQVLQELIVIKRIEAIYLVMKATGWLARKCSMHFHWMKISRLRMQKWDGSKEAMTGIGMVHRHLSNAHSSLSQEMRRSYVDLQ